MDETNYGIGVHVKFSFLRANGLLPEPMEPLKAISCVALRRACNAKVSYFQLCFDD